MAIACLAAEAEHAGDKLARRGYALIDGSDAALAEARTAFDSLLGGAAGSQRVTPDHPLVAALLAQPAVHGLVAEVVGPGAKVVRAVAVDRRTSFPVGWHQAEPAPSSLLRLRWHLDLIGPADGGLRVLPGSHRKGRLTRDAIRRLAGEIPAVELAVSAGTVMAIRPLLVQAARRRATQGHRRVLHVELAAGARGRPA